MFIILCTDFMLGDSSLKMLPVVVMYWEQSSVPAGCLRVHSLQATDITCRICMYEVHGTVYRERANVTRLDLSIFAARTDGESAPCLAHKMNSWVFYWFIIVSKIQSRKEYICHLLAHPWLTVFIRLCAKNGGRTQTKLVVASRRKDVGVGHNKL